MTDDQDLQQTRIPIVKANSKASEAWLGHDRTLLGTENQIFLPLEKSQVHPPPPPFSIDSPHRVTEKPSENPVKELSLFYRFYLTNKCFVIVSLLLDSCPLLTVIVTFIVTHKPFQDRFELRDNIHKYWEGARGTKTQFQTTPVT